MSNKSIPNAHVSLNKNRLKHYDRVDVGHNEFNNAVFLSDGDQFEIELDNPTNDTYLARIELNGNKISDSGIVLRPGEHIFLERYLEEKRRFSFETYSVPERNVKAVEENGLVKVKFYKEKSRPSYNDGPIIKTDFDYDYDKPYTIYADDDNKWTFTGTDTSGNIANYSSAISCDASTSSRSFSSEKGEGEIDTGRVEKGKRSNQSFVEVNKNFKTFVDYTDTIKLIPKSSKPSTKQDIRVYCPNCGKKLKESWNFCTQCGTERP